MNIILHTHCECPEHDEGLASVAVLDITADDIRRWQAMMSQLGTMRSTFPGQHTELHLEYPDAKRPDFYETPLEVHNPDPELLAEYLEEEEPLALAMCALWITPLELSWRFRPELGFVDECTNPLSKEDLGHLLTAITAKEASYF